MHSKVRKHSVAKTVQDEIERHTRLGESGVDAFTMMRVAGQQCHDKPAACAPEPRDGRTCIRQTGDLEQEIGRVGGASYPRSVDTRYSFRYSRKGGTVSPCGPVAQRSEQRTHNPLVLGSNPSGPTSFYSISVSLTVS